MAMQLSCLPSQPIIPLPPDDIEIMKTEIGKINVLIRTMDENKTTEDTYAGLKSAVETINEIIISLDNANDFYKLGGFSFLKTLLSCPNAEVVAATSELVADLCQNNSFCQKKILNINLLPELVKLMGNPDKNIRGKALYAVSCFCRHNEEAINQLSDSSSDFLFVESLMNILSESDERLRTKAAFFLSYLSTFESFREILWKADVVKRLIQLLKEEQNTSSEHLLSALLAQVSKHKQSRLECRLAEHRLKEALLEKLKLYNSKEEYQEAKEYCVKILDVCFHDELKS